DGERDLFGAELGSGGGRRIRVAGGEGAGEGEGEGGETDERGGGTHPGQSHARMAGGSSGARRPDGGAGAGALAPSANPAKQLAISARRRYRGDDGAGCPGCPRAPRRDPARRGRRSSPG